MPVLWREIVLSLSGFREKVFRPLQAHFVLICIVHLHLQRLLKADKEEALRKMNGLAWV
jgi:hypothetical protein